MTARTVQGRIAWFMGNNPPAVGQCLNHTWEAIRLPHGGIPDANAAVAYLRDNHKLYQGNPPRGAMVLWTSPTHGHAALSLGHSRLRGWRICSTDVNGPATVGRVPLSYISVHWGHVYAGWSDWWGGETYPVGRPTKEGNHHV